MSPVARRLTTPSPPYFLLPLPLLPLTPSPPLIGPDHHPELLRFPYIYSQKPTCPHTSPPAEDGTDTEFRNVGL